jgi:UDP-N-acetyl-D-mannosaminuronate dehydrogenase
MKKIIGIGLIVLSIGLGYMGITEFSNSGESVEVIGIEISAEDNKQKTTGIIYLGLAVASFIGGVSLVKSKS